MISVVVPIFNQREVALQCIDSVLTARVEQPYRLIVIDDACTDESLVGSLARLQADPRVQVFRNPVNSGFTKSANRGMSLAVSDSDPLLLNSDTIVYDHWLDAMHDCMRGRPDVATVTPLTNQFGSHITCYPHAGWADECFPELDDRQLADLAYRKCRDAAVEVHTGVGFCMLINRAAIRAVGLFDEVHFPRAYGEEADFCYRTRSIGWRHLVCGGTFVTHLHARSFGEEKIKLRDEMLEVFRRLHPSQPATDAAFIEADPVRVLRRRLDLARLGMLLDGPPETRAMPVHEDGATPMEPVRLEAAGNHVTFRLAGSDLGVPNIGSYVLPGDLARLAADLASVDVSALRFYGRPELAKHCLETARALLMEARLEESVGSTLLAW
jgi:GT2 family glycosyltransferase